MKKNINKRPTGKNHTVAMKPLTGVLDMTRSGVGYVIISEEQEDIFINRNDLGTALDGDTVVVKVTRKSSVSGKLEGRIIDVLKRNQTDFMGVLNASEGFGFVNIISEKPLPDFYVSAIRMKNIPDGSRVLVKFLKWDSPDKKPEAEIIKVIQPEDENNFAMQNILTENGFTIGFDDAVKKESEALPDTLPQQEINRRKDFRDVLTFTVDPLDAKDFDDAISFKKIDEHWFEIGVHIADVSYYVRPGTALDDEAYKRATSVYLPDRVNPMLPEHISNVLCSLRPDEDKFTFSAVFTMNKNGAIRDTWFGRTVIRSNRRFTYEEAQDIIDGGAGDHSDVILTIHEIAQNIRRQRFEKGAINFSSTEVRFVLDDKGKPIGIVVKESKPSHQLIEEFMLIANKAVAEQVSKVKIKGQPLPFPYRVHDKPDEEKLQAFLPIAMKFGFKFDLNTPKTIAESFNNMLQQIQGKPEMHVLEQLGVRTMAKAVYTTENVGHYGLGFENYCHFTSPIRRYPDVMVHRVLDAVLNNSAKPDKEMEEKCIHCSERERAAMDAERDGDKYKQIEYMREHLGEDFDGVISGVSSFGFWVETINEKCEGMVSLMSLSYMDTFEHIEGEFMLRGIRTGKTFRMGDRIRIKVIAADLDKRQMDYEWIPKPGGEPQKDKPTSKPAKKPKRNAVGQKKEK
ncbi:ribonuclease R [Haoranjiania flava]|uniref:Ribonuclease R n=1 Tax=Haoranjiania flava TaxID=1856322 RepID=A0AAE3IN74_9BACT|nr:ribonuclease R [Haoranjiania flava]MCU7693406.1 ribonuclease R [Haoranjiania flava]